MSKVVWRVQEAPTGMYRSFQKRGWPQADYGKDGPIAATIYCKDEYRPRNVKTGEHGELTVRIADHSTKPWTWKVARRKCKTLAEAKELVARVLEQNPGLSPANVHDS